MDKGDLVELIPHYVAMLLLMFLVLGAVRQAVSDVSFWMEIAIIFVLVLAYRAVVQRLGYGPDAWEVER